MNCEDYRQEISADPSFDGGAGHLSECHECQAYRKEMLSLNEKISRAMQLPIPELRMPELPAIKDKGAGTDNIVSLGARRPRPRAGWFAIAATVMLAAFVGVRMFTVDVGHNALADEVLAHLDHEPYALRPTNLPVSDARLARIVPASVASFDRDKSLITYAQSCIINGNTVPHLVVQGEHGPITILLMPDEAVSDAVPLDGDNTHGVILPVGGGSVAIIGAREEQLDDVEKSVLDSVRWST